MRQGCKIGRDGLNPKQKIDGDSTTIHRVSNRLANRQWLSKSKSNKGFKNNRIQLSNRLYIVYFQAPKNHPVFSPFSSKNPAPALGSGEME
jgi:hypothetical protein